MITPTDLERAVADAIAEAMSPSDMEGWIVTELELAAARAAIAACFRWRPIETAPKDGTDILAVWDAPRPKWRARGVVRWHDGEWLTRPGDWGMRPIGWLPLPPPPDTPDD